MTDIRFKPLGPKDVEVRVAQCTERGCSLLLYKDARCDMRMLDEAVGPENWGCDYDEVKGNLFCRVGIRTDTNGWVYKQDVGIPSNVDAQKGEASDAFKRACFKWGIGRELYTAPFMWVPAERLASLKMNDKGKWACHDRFSVASMTIDGGEIAEVSIRNDRTGKVVWQSGDEAAGRDPRLRGRLTRLRELGFKADELGFERDYIELASEASFGKPTSELTVEQLDELGKSVKQAIEAVERGE